MTYEEVERLKIGDTIQPKSNLKEYVFVVSENDKVRESLTVDVFKSINGELYAPNLRYSYREVSECFTFSQNEDEKFLNSLY